MKSFDHELPPDLEQVAERLKKERPEPGALELDRAKLRSITAGSRRAPRPGLGITGAGRLVPLLVLLGLMAGGTAVFASSGRDLFKAGASHESAARKQYCPKPPKKDDDDEDGDHRGDRNHRSSEQSDHRSGEKSDRGERSRPKDECDRDDDEDDDDQDEGDDDHRSNHRHHDSSSDRVRHKRRDD
jgi:hypothetical protein